MTKYFSKYEHCKVKHILQLLSRCYQINNSVEKSQAKPKINLELTITNEPKNVKETFCSMKIIP